MYFHSAVLVNADRLDVFIDLSNQTLELKLTLVEKN